MEPLDAAFSSSKCPTFNGKYQPLMHGVCDSGMSNTLRDFHRLAVTSRLTGCDVTVGFSLASKKGPSKVYALLSLSCPRAFERTKRGKGRREGASWRRKERPHVREEGGEMHTALLNSSLFSSSHSFLSAKPSCSSLPISTPHLPLMLIPLSSALQAPSLFFRRSNAALQGPCRIL